MPEIIEQELNDYCAEKNITPAIKLIEMKDINQAFGRMD